MYSQAVAVQGEAQIQATATDSTVDSTFAQGLCFYKLVWVFALCSVIGVIVETVFCFIFKGYFESRQGMLYGPFNQIYGFGAVLLALVLHRVQSKGPLMVFGVSALLGGVFEAVCSLLQQQYLGTVPWDYKWMPFAIGSGRTNLLYMIFFGILGVSFVRYVYRSCPGSSKGFTSARVWWRPGSLWRS